MKAEGRKLEYKLWLSCDTLKTANLKEMIARIQKALCWWRLWCLA